MTSVAFTGGAEPTITLNSSNAYQWVYDPNLFPTHSSGLNLVQSTNVGFIVQEVEFNITRTDCDGLMGITISVE